MATNVYESESVIHWSHDRRSHEYGWYVSTSSEGGGATAFRSPAKRSEFLQLVQDQFPGADDLEVLIYAAGLLIENHGEDPSFGTHLVCESPLDDRGHELDWPAELDRLTSESDATGNARDVLRRAAQPRMESCAMCRDLKDAGEGQAGSVAIKAEFKPDVLSIRAEGYGDAGTIDGHGCPLFVELYEGHLRVVAFPDINCEEPVVIDLEGARESARHDDRLICTVCGNESEAVNEHDVCPDCQ